MFRKLLLPALAIGLLGGCVTGGYQYDSAGYYYGQPSTSYRYSDGYYGGGYGYPGYAPSYYGSLYYGGGYRNPGYRYPGYGYSNYPYGYYRPPVIVVRPGHNGNHGGNHGNHGNRPPSGDRDNRAPWRDYERLQRERIQRSTPPPTGNRPGATLLRPPVPAQPSPAAVPSRSVQSSSLPSTRNSRNDRMIERARTSRQEE